MRNWAANCRFPISRLMLLSCALPMLRPLEAMAQAAGPALAGGGSGAGRGASAGALVTAVMEQVGYHAQAKVISDLSGYLEWSAALIYLGVIFSMILTVALNGNYRAALWALVGPALFYYASGISFRGEANTIQGAGVEWRFGGFDDTKVNNEKTEMMSRPNVGTPGEVSFLFHKYNELVSEVIQKGIVLITNNDMRRQMRFMGRQRAMEELFGDQIVNPDIRALSAYFMIHCATEISYAGMLARGNRDPTYQRNAEYQMAREQYCQLFPRRDKPFTTGPWYDYVIDAGLWNPQQSPMTALVIGESDHRNNSRKEETVTSCADMWQWLRNGAQREVLLWIGDTVIRTVSLSAITLFGTRFAEENYQEILRVLTEQRNVTPERVNSPGDPCPEASGSAIEGAGNSDTITRLANILAGFLIKKTLMSTPPAELMTRVQSANHGFTAIGTAQVNISNPITRQDILRRQSAHQFSQARRYEAFMLINLLPYLQGVLLYVLAVTYPFFTLMLILPSQAGGFLTWMSLWAWAKCWDLGWALIVVADDVIWELMPKAAYFNSNPSASVDAAYRSPISLLETAFGGDPSYSMATYWMLISTMVTGVPIVTAQAVMGTKRAIAGIMMKGVTDFADSLSTGAQNYLATEQVRKYTMARENNASNSVAQSSMAAFSQIMHQNEMLAGALGEGPLTETLKGVEPIAKFNNSFTAWRTASSKLRTLETSGAPLAEIDAAKKTLADANALMTQQSDVLKKRGQDAGQRAAAQGIVGASRLAETPAAQQLMTWLGGVRASPEVIAQWRQDNVLPIILNVLNIPNVEAGGEGAEAVTDDTIRQGLIDLRAQMWLRQVYAYSDQAFGEAVMTMGGPLAAGGGYSVGGSLGAYNMFMRTADTASASTNASYQAQWQIAYSDLRQLETQNRWMMYSMNNHPSWLLQDYSRARFSRRGEFFMHTGVPNDSFYLIDQLAMENQLFFRNLDNRHQGVYYQFFMGLPGAINRNAP